MIKRLATVLVLLLALHFLVVVGAVGYLFGTGKLDRARLREIAKVLNPETPAPATLPVEEPSRATTRPLMQFDELLATQTGRSASAQVQFLRDTFDGLSAQLDRRHRELLDLQRQIDAAELRVSTARAAVETREKAIDERETQAAKLAADKGFQRTLEIYESMAPKQIKDAFVKEDSELVARYLQSMEPKRVASILKEFKSPAEQTKANALLDRLRSPEPAAGPEAAGAAAR